MTSRKPASPLSLVASACCNPWIIIAGNGIFHQAGGSFYDRSKSANIREMKMTFSAWPAPTEKKNSASEVSVSYLRFLIFPFRMCVVHRATAY